MRDTVSDRFKQAGIRQGWWNCEKVAVALSGGSDSMALLWLLTNFWHGQVVAVHVEHGIRGKRSLEDASFVKSHCAKLGIDCTVIKKSIPREAEKGESIEVAARRVRHLALTDFCARSGAHAVLLAHNSDDAVETFFLNLVRGTGPCGLAGIPESNGVLFRPVMDISKEELRDILRKARWDWVEDETNDQDLYLRNRIRNELLPLMEQRLNPGVRRHVLALIKEMASLRRQEEITGAALYERSLANLPFCLSTLSRARVMEIDRTRRIWLLRCAGRLLGLRTLSRSRTEKLADLLETSSRWRFQWSEDVEMCADSDHLSWVKRGIVESSPYEPLILDGTGNAEINGLSLSWSVVFDKGDHAAAFNGMTLRLPVSTQDKVELRSLSQVAEKARGRFPWWIRAFIPVVLKNGIPLWTPRLGDWSGRWDFPKDSVKCDGLCRITFTYSQTEREDGLKNGL